MAKRKYTFKPRTAEHADNLKRSIHSRSGGSTPEERFWAKVRKGDGCWEWQGALMKGPHTYGFFKLPGVGGLAHRASWFFAHGSVPSDMKVCHQCDNPKCVRPDHLFLGTNAENMQDASRKKRMRGQRQGDVMPVGSAHGMARLDENGVREIRRSLAAGVSRKALAQRFGVSKTTIKDIATRATWRHVDTEKP